MFDGCFQLLFALLHIFSCSFYVLQAKPKKNLLVQEGESYQIHRESDHQMFMTLLDSDQMDFSSFFPILFRFSLMIHPFIFLRFIYQHTLGSYH